MATAPRVQRSERIGAELAGERLDKAAARVFADFSRTQISAWIRSGVLTVDGAPAQPKQRLVGGERLALDAPTVSHEHWTEPQGEVDFTVVFEDADLLVIDKPAGLVVHPGAGNADRTLVNGLLAYRPDLAAVPRVGLVHRLDKDTGGLLVVAGSARAHTVLTRAMARHTVGRRYVAVVEGVLTGGRVIDAPIGRDPRNRLRQRVTEGGRRAVTRIVVRERMRAASVIEAALETGRTHQIRVHLAAIGHPLVGDRRYGARGRLPPRPDAALIAAIRGFRRQALHAAELELVHPITGAALAFTSPLPADMVALIDVLRRDRDAAAADGQ